MLETFITCETVDDIEPNGFSLVLLLNSFPYSVYISCR